MRNVTECEGKGKGKTQCPSRRKKKHGPETGGNIDDNFLEYLNLQRKSIDVIQGEKIEIV